ncbi:MAG: hypothetical protein GY751_11095 [Bacteroidetes bacterium]|nr:hypothetical protein [Bacteroidota bacterium]
MDPTAFNVTTRTIRDKGLYYKHMLSVNLGGGLVDDQPHDESISHGFRTLDEMLTVRLPNGSLNRCHKKLTAGLTSLDITGLTLANINSVYEFMDLNSCDTPTFVYIGVNMTIGMIEWVNHIEMESKSFFGKVVHAISVDKGQVGVMKGDIRFFDIDTQTVDEPVDLAIYMKSDDTNDMALHNIRKLDSMIVANGNMIIELELYQDIDRIKDICESYTTFAMMRPITLPSQSRSVFLILKNKISDQQTYTFKHHEPLMCPLTKDISEDIKDEKIKHTISDTQFKDWYIEGYEKAERSRQDRHWSYYYCIREWQLY